MRDIDGLVQISDSMFAKAVDVLNRAFWNDPMNEYFFPDETKRKRILTTFFKFRLKQGRECGVLYTTSEDVEGVAIWKYHDKLDLPLWRSIRFGGLGLLRLCGRAGVNRMTSVNNWISKRRNGYATLPYLHLGPFAVDPDMQGKGYASKLLRPMLAHLDEISWHCYLETQNESHVSLYEHFGFEVLAKGVVPEANIPHWDMIRYHQ